jgi:type II secretory pathway component PulJ
LNKTSVTAINTKYLGGYRTEKLARVKAMRFYLGYINHLGRLQKKSARLVRQAHQPVRQAGFTITEVLLASSMMLIAISVSGIGVTNLLRSNYRANAGTEIQNNLNRTLEFVSDDLRRARIIADSEAAITSTQVPTGARAVLAFQISDPNNPGQAPLNEQIVYYTQNSQTGDSLTGLVLWRYGPNLDENGNYITPADITTWIRSPVTDRLADATNNLERFNCDPFQTDIEIPTGWKRIPAVRGEVEGFYVCVRDGGNQVILNANAEVNLTTGDTDKDKVKYSVSTRVSPRAAD